jgi:hypothetical protein
MDSAFLYAIIAGVFGQSLAVVVGIFLTQRNAVAARLAASHAQDATARAEEAAVNAARLLVEAANQVPKVL